jgi:hypothetical protein
MRHRIPVCLTLGIYEKNPGKRKKSQKQDPPSKSQVITKINADSLHSQIREYLENKNPNIQANNPNQQPQE